MNRRKVHSRAHTRRYGIYRAHCQIQAAKKSAFPRRISDGPWEDVSTIAIGCGAQWVHVDGKLPWLGTPAQARALANALNDAADAVEGVTW